MNKNRKKAIPFSDDELKFIKDNYTEMSDAKIAKVLGRSVDSVSFKRIKMNLLKYSSRAKETSEIDKEYNMIIWWLTGDTFDTIRLLYSCSNEDIENALKQTDKMKLAIKRIKKYGCFPIVRTEREIKRWECAECERY